VSTGANSSPAQPVTADGWSSLRSATAARIALGRAGASLPTREVLDFGLAHAQARDAVHAALDVSGLRAELEADGWPVLEVRSRAAERSAYLARPDWGRRLHADSAAALRLNRPGAAPDVVFVASDGLSAVAVQHQAAPLLRALRGLLGGLSCAPIVIATQARVALADEVGEILGARAAVSLIGERPGLSAADSLGLYLTYGPRLGRSDAERNCISNVRPLGLSHAAAAHQLAVLLHSALHARLSGVGLCADPQALAAAQAPNLLQS
jgi:ethanolamine ammonia-lyase small subunit